MSTAFYSHAECRLHDMGDGHPECPQRLDAIADHLLATGLDIALRVQRDAPMATLEQLERAHTVNYVTQLKECMEQVQASRRAAAPGPRHRGLPRHLARRAAPPARPWRPPTTSSPAAENAFCAVRPPGHHATRDETMGFCFFNNVAVAARHALDVLGLERVAIIDFDVHHGNGTEDIIAGDDRVLMCSFFQHPLYPYSGAVPKGTNMVNVPVAALHPRHGTARD
jgi:acetoin utilization deacetylase AcuC-like enzyme